MSPSPDSKEPSAAQHADGSPRRARLRVVDGNGATRRRSRTGRRSVASKPGTADNKETPTQRRRRQTAEQTLLARLIRAPRPEPDRGDAADSGMTERYARSTNEAARAGATRRQRQSRVAASDLPRGLVFLMPGLPRLVATQLLRLVSHSVAAPSSRELRDARLGLVVQLLRERNAELVPTAEYMAERARRQRRGESWPSATALTRAFGEWRTVLLAALHLGFRGADARQSRSRHHTGPRPTYTEDEALKALIRCRDALGVWPLDQEYIELVELSRRAARSAGLPEPRFPGTTPIRRLFGNYTTFVAKARARYGEPDESWPRAVVDLTAAGEEELAGGPDDSRAHPLAERLWLLLRDLPVADRRLVYFALARALRGNGSLRAEVCLRALRACQLDLDVPYVSRRACGEDRFPRRVQLRSSRRRRAEDLLNRRPAQVADFRSTC